MTDQQYNEISGRLNMLVRLAALLLVGDRTQQEKIMILSGAGFQPKEIADICGTTGNTVNVALSTMRKKQEEKKQKGKKSKARASQDATDNSLE